jgi:hypothetical protein
MIDLFNVVFHLSKLKNHNERKLSSVIIIVDIDQITVLSLITKEKKTDKKK